MATLTNATVAQIAERFQAAIKAQEKHVTEHADVTNTKGRFVNVDSNGVPYKGIMVATSWGPKADTFLGKYDAVAVLEKVIAEAGVAVTPYAYDKATRKIGGTLVEVIAKLQEAKKIAVHDGKGLRIYGPEMIDATNGKAVKVNAITSTKDLF